LTHENEYPDSMVALLELIWGDGFMAPGGDGNVSKMTEGLDLKGKRVLDIGCGLGGPACLLATQYGAQVVGIDLEPRLIERSQRRASKLGLVDRTEFVVVETGPLDFADETFDLVMSSGGVTQTADKLGTFRDCLRVLKPGGTFSLYDWMKREGEYSEDMRYWFEMEELTYAMVTPANQESILREAGFESVTVTDRSDWYPAEVRVEYDRLRNDLYDAAVRIVGEERADHTVENWRATVVVCEKGEMLQVYSRGRRPGSSSR
jgi:ubiquinone/menaquinone biosynthesis C-methylase UbiE